MTAGVPDYRDARVAAAFLICPAIARQLAPESLRRVTSPVRVWWADADTIAPLQDNALLYRDTIPNATGNSASPNVEHYHFLGDNPDGAPARDHVTADAVAFFRSQLAAQRQD
jgi:predicted dienelactone hydrolase